MTDLWHVLRRLQVRTTDWHRFTGRTAAIAARPDASRRHEDGVQLARLAHPARARAERLLDLEAPWR